MWEVYAPEDGHVNAVSMHRRKIVGITAYLINELKLAGLSIEDGQNGLADDLTAWCKVLYVSSEVSSKGVPLITSANWLLMKVDWRCGIDERGSNVWQARYHGEGDSGPSVTYTAAAKRSMGHRAYARAMEQIVWDYVNDVIEYIDSGKKPST